MGRKKHDDEGSETAETEVIPLRGTTLDPEEAAAKATFARAVPWKEPFPEAKLDADGADLVLVKAVPTQDLRINGTLLPEGRVVTLPCSVAHAHGQVLKAPKE